MSELKGLRICLIGPLPPPAGGMAMQTRQLADLLRAEGATVEIVQSNRVPGPAWLRNTRGLRGLARLLSYLAALWPALGRADLVHLMANSGWSWRLVAAPALRFAAWRGRPVIVNYRGGGAPAFLERHARTVRAGLGRASALVVPSGFLKAVFDKHGIAAEVVPNIVDLERFAPAAEPPSAPHIVVARNLERIYDLPTALAAFARVRAEFPAARMSVAGSGPQAGELKALAQGLELGDSLRFVGRIDRDAMACLLRTATVALNPSRVDNMPNSVLEAMAAGVPIVSTSVGGVPYIVGDRRSALLVGPGDAVAMASALTELHRDPALAKGLAAEASADVAQYAWSQVRQKWLAVYRRALDGRCALSLEVTGS